MWKTPRKPVGSSLNRPEQVSLRASALPAQRGEINQGLSFSPASQTQTTNQQSGSLKFTQERRGVRNEFLCAGLRTDCTTLDIVVIGLFDLSSWIHEWIIEISYRKLFVKYSKEPINDLELCSNFEKVGQCNLFTSITPPGARGCENSSMNRKVLLWFWIIFNEFCCCVKFQILFQDVGY